MVVGDGVENNYAEDWTATYSDTALQGVGQTFTTSASATTGQLVVVNTPVTAVTPSENTGGSGNRVPMTVGMVMIGLVGLAFFGYRRLRRV